MTQKELNYVEDAIGHEQNIIKILEFTKSNIQNENLKTFIDSEYNIHISMKEYLLNMLEGKINEWWTING